MEPVGESVDEVTEFNESHASGEDLTLDEGVVSRLEGVEGGVERRRRA